LREGCNETRSLKLNDRVAVKNQPKLRVDRSNLFHPSKFKTSGIFAAEGVMGTLSVTETQYVLLVLRQAKMSTREGAVSLLGDLKTEFGTGRAQCAADARTAVGRAVKTLKDCLNEGWPSEHLWREALDLTALWKAQLK
jgi:hypothetical protein